jgi:hypothetical protein
MPWAREGESIKCVWSFFRRWSSNLTSGNATCLLLTALKTNRNPFRTEAAVLRVEIVFNINVLFSLERRISSSRKEVLGGSKLFGPKVVVLYLEGASVVPCPVARQPGTPPLFCLCTCRACQPLNKILILPEIVFMQEQVFPQING